MQGMQRRPLGNEQLVPLWTWLLEGHLPVAYIVAELDELETFELNASKNTQSGRHWAGRFHGARDAA
jgi:hypothetical protein